MKRFLSVAVMAISMASGGALAANHKYCDAMFDYAVTIADGRDMGVTMTQSMDIAFKNSRGNQAYETHARNMIAYIYLHPEISTALVSEDLRVTCEDYFSRVEGEK